MTQDNKMQAGTVAKPRRWERILLVASLGLNLLVAGVVVGGVATHERRAPPPSRSVGDVSIGPFTDAFDKEDREALRLAVEAQSTSFRDMRRALDADFARLVEALKADPWDETVVRSVIFGMRERLTARSEIGERLIFERLEAMDTGERQAFAMRLEERLKHRGKRKGKQGDDDRRTPDAASDR